MFHNSLSNSRISAVALFCSVILFIGFFSCGNSPTGSGEEGESGRQYGLSDTATETRNGIRLVMKYDSQKKSFTGTLVNTTNESVADVRVEIHLSNGVELGPTPRVNMTPGQTSPVTLDAGGQNFNQWSVHVEIGKDGD